MCGIAGFKDKNLNESSRENLLNQLCSLQVHRGPDFTGTWKNEKNFFVHHRLSLIDGASRSNQPFYNDNFVLCYNGEIYNYKELKLQLPNVEFVTTSDTEVLFHYLINYGIEKTLNDIKGMFAFSFYNCSENKLILARDRFGIKPLYYANTEKTFAFASEKRTLAKSLGLKPDSYKTIMAMNSITEGSSTFTLFNEIENVKPGTFLIINENCEVKEFYYYTIASQISEQEYKKQSKKSKNDVVAEFDYLIKKSVKSMLVSDFKMGSFVSGGIDSSLLTAIAKDYTPDIELFTADIIGKHSEFDDAKFLADSLDLKLHKTDFKPNDFLNYWLNATEYNAGPIVYFTNAVPISRVAHLARQHNVKAVLAGEGSDELFLGYSKLMAQRYKKALLMPLETLKHIYKIYPALNNYLFPSEKDSLQNFNTNFATGFKGKMTHSEGIDAYGFIPSNKRKYYVDSYDMIQNHLQALLYRNDRMGMISSIEVRFPFLDEEIVKFAINLPLEYKTRWTSKLHNKKHPFITDKWIVREVSKSILPKQLVAKKKNGLPIDGLNGVRFKKEFFANGYLAENMKLTNKTIQYILDNENPYFIGKLASVELFGLLYDYNLSNNEIQQKIDDFAVLSL